VLLHLRHLSVPELSIQEHTKVHPALCSEHKAEVIRENGLIYNAILSVPKTFPLIHKTMFATPIFIQEAYGTPEVQKVV
jgi:hypothetical protein